MLVPELRDLIKPPWRKVLEELKVSGGMAVSDLAREIGGSYMAVRSHCEELVSAGYLIRTRLPRTAVGRPEVFYSLAAKADGLFPQAGIDVTLELLAALKQMVGESAPEKLLFQYFHKQHERWDKALRPITGTGARAVRLAVLREQAGCTNRCEQPEGEPLRIVEYHNPLHRIFEHYPRAVVMELRMLEQLLGTRVTRRELAGGREMPPRIVFEITAH